MKRAFSKEKSSAFILGALCVLGALFATGALKPVDGTVEGGRYRMRVLDEDNYHSIFVVDSQTGVVKIAYHKHKTGMQQIDNMGKDFGNY
jgi:hypothetical protein